LTEAPDAIASDAAVCLSSWGREPVDPYFQCGPVEVPAPEVADPQDTALGSGEHEVCGCLAGRLSGQVVDEEAWQRD
jgi:hypothetical protein